jgi:hypothetical protein
MLRPAMAAPVLVRSWISCGRDGYTDQITAVDPKPTFIASTRHRKPDIQGTRNRGVCRACATQGLA